MPPVPIQSAKEQADALAQRVSASGSRSPSLALDAFFPKEIRVGRMEIAPITLTHLAALERVKSPLMLSEEPAPVSMEDAAKALFILSMKPKDLVAVMATTTPEQFAEMAFDFGLRVPADEAPNALAAVEAAIQRAFSTAMGGDTSNPTAPAGRSSAG